MFPTGEFNNWPRCRLLVPHVESLVGKEPMNAEEAIFERLCSEFKGALRATGVESSYVRVRRLKRK